MGGEGLSSLCVYVAVSLLVCEGDHVHSICVYICVCPYVCAVWMEGGRAEQSVAVQ